MFAVLPLKKSKRKHLKLEISDGTFLYSYDNRMCYFDALIEKF